MAGSAGGAGGGTGGGAGGTSGGSGAGGGGGPTGGAPNAGAGPVEVIDSQGNSLGGFGRDGKPMGPKISTTPTRPTDDSRGRDPARDLVEKIAKTLGDQTQQARPEAEVPRGQEARLEALEGRGTPAFKQSATAAKSANDAVGPRPDAANDSKRGQTMTIDADTAERVAAARARDSGQAAEELKLKSTGERKTQRAGESEPEIGRPAQPDKSARPQGEENRSASRSESRRNQVESDEPMTPHTDAKRLVPKEVEDKYLRVGDKFYDPRSKDKVAFEDKGSRLETRSNSEQVADAMVRIAQARGWNEIKVSGSETFRKEVWLEASAKGMEVRGYTPSDLDRAELAKRSKDLDANKVEPGGKASRGRESDAAADRQATDRGSPAAPEADGAGRRTNASSADAERHARAEAFAHKPPGEAVRQYPELAPAYAAVASAERKVDADKLSPEAKAVVMARVRQNVENSIERGDIPDVKLREDRETVRDRSRGRIDDREVTR